MTRPRRYPRSPLISNIVDLVTVLEDELRARGDWPNATRAASARSLIVDIALGTKGGR